MKKLLVLCFCVVVTVPLFGQSMKKMLAEIEGKYELDNSGNVTFARIIGVPGVSKDDLYVRALAYFTYNYNDGDAVIQIQEKDRGVIVGRGLYNDVHVGVYTTVDTYHVLRVDVKDERLRVMITLTEYCIDGYINYPVSSQYPLSQYPLSELAPSKKTMGKAFYKSYQAAMSSLDRIERSVKEGNTGIESTDW